MLIKSFDINSLFVNKKSILFWLHIYLYILIFINSAVKFCFSYYNYSFFFAILFKSLLYKLSIIYLRKVTEQTISFNKVFYQKKCEFSQCVSFYCINARNCIMFQITITVYVYVLNILFLLIYFIRTVGRICVYLLNGK